MARSSGYRRGQRAFVPAYPVGARFTRPGRADRPWRADPFVLFCQGHGAVYAELAFAAHLQLPFHPYCGHFSIRHPAGSGRNGHTTSVPPKAASQGRRGRSGHGLRGNGPPACGRAYCG